MSICTRASVYEQDGRTSWGQGVFTGDQQGLGEGLRRDGEAWPELVASGFVPGSARCWRRVSEQACAPCAAGMGDNCFFTCRVPTMTVGLQDQGQIPQIPQQPQAGLSCVPGAGVGCCRRGCCLLYTVRVSTVTGNLSGITGQWSQAGGGSQSK